MSVIKTPLSVLDISSIDSLLIAWWKMMMVMRQGKELDTYAPNVPRYHVIDVEKAYTLMKILLAMTCMVLRKQNLMMVHTEYMSIV